MALRHRLPDRITNFPLKYQILLGIPTDAKCIYFNILVNKQDIIRLAMLPYYNFHKGVIVKFTINLFRFNLFELPEAEQDAIFWKS